MKCGVDLLRRQVFRVLGRGDDDLDQQVDLLPEVLILKRPCTFTSGSHCSLLCPVSRTWAAIGCVGDAPTAMSVAAAMVSAMAEATC